MGLEQSNRNSVIDWNQYDHEGILFLLILFL